MSHITWTSPNGSAFTRSVGSRKAFIRTTYRIDYDRGVQITTYGLSVEDAGVMVAFIASIPHLSTAMAEAERYLTGDRADVTEIERLPKGTDYIYT